MSTGAPASCAERAPRNDKNFGVKCANSLVRFCHFMPCSVFLLAILLVRALQVTPTVAARKPGRKPKKPKPPFTLSLGVTCTILP